MFSTKSTANAFGQNGEVNCCVTSGHINDKTSPVKVRFILQLRNLSLQTPQNTYGLLDLSLQGRLKEGVGAPSESSPRPLSLEMVLKCPAADHNAMWVY
jgi:hypothetical protein